MRAGLIGERLRISRSTSGPDNIAAPIQFPSLAMRISRASKNTLAEFCQQPYRVKTLVLLRRSVGMRRKVTVRKHTEHASFIDVSGISIGLRNERPWRSSLSPKP